MKLTNLVVYFLYHGDAATMNNGRKICAGIPSGFEVSGTQNITATFRDSTESFIFNGVAHATSLADALTDGNKWMTVEEAEGYGIDLTNPDQDIDALVNP